MTEGLPIGSGEIENAEYMLALRINHLNGDWDALAASPPDHANPNCPKVSQNAAA